MSSLFVLRGNDQGARFELDGATISIGRDPTNTIQLHDTEVSRRHAEFRRAGQQYAIVDLGSSNGTHVNNRRIQYHLLEYGDEVKVGNTVIIYKGAIEDGALSVDKVDIISRQNEAEDSQIVQSLDSDESHHQLLGSSSQQKAPGPWFNRAISNLEVMYRTTLAVRQTLDIDQLLARILKIIFEWVEADRGCILLMSQDARKLDPRVRRHRRGADVDEKIVISKTIIDYVMKRGQGVLTSDAGDDSRWSPAASILKHNIREAICVPMQGRHNDMLGMIYIDTSTSPDLLLKTGVAKKFTEEHLKLMIAIGHTAAMAVEDTRYYSELMQAERLAAIGQTIATLSHHTKNILQGIRGASYLIQVGLADYDKAIEKVAESPEKAAVVRSLQMMRKGWDMCEKNQNKIENLVMDMLTFSKEREPSLEPADLNQVVEDVVELMETRAADQGVRLVWRPDAKMPILTFDPEGLHRAVLNVVTNGIDACDSREDGCVVVTTEFVPKENMGKVHVEDNGVGIPADEIEKIFILFNSSKKGRGTGLGLSVSNKILREHGGKIAVKSELGKGSRFSLLLPAITRDEANPSDPRITITQPKG